MSEAFGDYPRLFPQAAGAFKRRVEVDRWSLGETRAFGFISPELAPRLGLVIPPPTFLPGLSVSASNNSLASARLDSRRRSSRHWW